MIMHWVEKRYYHNCDEKIVMNIDILPEKHQELIPEIMRTVVKNGCDVAVSKKMSPDDEFMLHFELDITQMTPQIVDEINKLLESI